MRGKSSCRKHNIHSRQPPEQHETKTIKQHECKWLQKHRRHTETNVTLDFKTYLATNKNTRLLKNQILIKMKNRDINMCCSQCRTIM